MSVVSSASRDKSGDKAAPADVAALPSETVTSAEGQLLCTLVGRLRERNRPIADVLTPILETRDRAVADVEASKVLPVVHRHDQLVFGVLSRRYDELDRTVRESSFAVAEIDGDGLISYANAALLALIPGAVGLPFAPLFGPRADDVRAALEAGERTSLRLELHGCDQGLVHLRGELGPLTDERGRRGAFALLLDVRAEERRFEASPDALLRLNTKGLIGFANRHAEKLLGFPRDELVGRPVDQFFKRRAPEDASKSLIEAWAQQDEGHKDEAEAIHRSGRTIPVRITVTPWFDTVSRRSGSLLNVVSIVQELAAAELQGLLTQPLQPEQLIRRILETVRRVLPCDAATFGIYTDNMRQYRTLAADPADGWPWITRWFPVGERAIEWLRAGRTWGHDLTSSVEEISPELAKDPTLQALKERGLKSFITLPIRGDRDTVRASLTLFFRDGGPFDASYLEHLQQLGDLRVDKALIAAVDQAAMVAEAALRRQRQEQLRAMKADVSAAPGPREIAKRLAYGVGRIFGWNYVAVYLVKRESQKFKLFEQYASHTEALPAGYEQPLDKGLLGTTLQRGEPCVVPDTRADSPAHGYRPTIPGSASALAVPIRVVGRVEWIIHVESSERNAFEGDDLPAIKELATECQHALSQRWQEALSTCLLDSAEQAVIVVDAAGQICRGNVRASALFAPENVPFVGTNLRDYGLGQHDQTRLSQTHAVEQEHLTLGISEEVHVPVLATQRPVNDDHGYRLWLFSDLRERNWQHDWRYLEETVNEVAQQVRVPLLKAGGLVREVMRAITDSSLSQNLDSAISQLRKADITYERLAGTLAVREGPDQPRQLFDALLVLHQTIDALPHEDAQHIVTDLDVTRFKVSGWPEHLAFVFRSLLGHLLQHRPWEIPIRLSARVNADRWLRLTFEVDSETGCEIAQPSADKSADPIAAAERQARATAALAPESIQTVVRQHKGTFDIEQRRTGLHYAISIPPYEG